MYRNIIPLYQNNNIYINILIFENRSQNEKSARTSPKYYITLLYISPFWGMLFYISCFFCISWGILIYTPDLSPIFSQSRTGPVKRLYISTSLYKPLKSLYKPAIAYYIRVYRYTRSFQAVSLYIRSFFRLCVRLFFWHIL